jgi:AAA domain-containing protein
MARIDRETLQLAIHDHAETICRHYLVQGKRIGKQWVVGNLNGDPGQSLRIELEGEKAGLAYDFATGEGCDLLEVIKHHTGLRFIEVAREIGRITAVNVEEPATQYTTGKEGRYQTGNSIKPFEWDKGYRLSSAHIDKVCPWRGFSRSYIVWVDEHRQFGCTKKGEWAFPVVVDGAIVAAHIRQHDGKWRYYPTLKDLGISLTPLIVGNLATAEKVFVGESPWDVFAVLDKLGIQHGEPIAGIATRSAINAALVATVEFRPGIEIYVIPQNDDPGQSWAQSVGTALAREFRLITVPTKFKDANDWLKALGNDVGEFVKAITDAGVQPSTPKQQRGYIEFHPPSYYMAYTPPPDLVLVGDCHIVRGNIFIIGGPPGVGKSRSSIGLALAVALRVQWFGLETLIEFRTLIIQSENGQFRLKQEFTEINEPELENHLMICPPPPYGLCFSRSEFKDQLQRAHDEFGPQLVLLDPWNAIAHDDRMKDYRESLDIIAEVFHLGSDKGPAIGILAHTRKPLIGERTDGRALLALLAGSYVLGSVPRCVFVMQSASDDVNETKVIWTCCKNNDGKLGPRTVWERRNGLFVPVKDFDWQAFDHPEQNKEFSPDLVVAWLAVLDQPATKQEIASGLVDSGMSRATAYRLIEKALLLKIIKFDSKTKTFLPT